MRFRPLTDAELAYRDNGLAIARRGLGVDGPLPQPAVQAIYAWCLERDWGPERLHDRAQVVGLGMAFGDLMARDMGLDWTWCDDDELSHLALRAPGHDVAIWPLWMVCRRLTERRDTTVAGMIQGVRNTVDGIDGG